MKSTSKYLCIEFHNAKGDLVYELSKCPANNQDVQSALNFLRPGCDFVCSIQECSRLDNGDIVTPFETIKKSDYE